MIEELLNEYARMREGGLEARSCLRALRPYIQPLPKAAKEALADQIRQWERDYTTDDSAPSPPPVVEDTPSTKKIDETSWVECPNCHKKNRAADVFCYACGTLLDDDKDAIDTRHFASADATQFSDNFYGSESVLVLTTTDDEYAYEARPQRYDHDLIIGRGYSAQGIRPDVDLATADAMQHGVSRLHLLVEYDDDSHVLRVTDRSSNGTFVNGQRLHPKDKRVLRNGDTLRLGNLVLKVQFVHPGDPLD